MAEETKTIVSSPKDYWISPNALSISLNALGDHDRIQASVASGAVIFCYIKDIADFDFDAGHNFRKWPLVISPTYFNSTTEKYLYVAIPRSNTIGSEAMIVFPSQLLDIYGRAAVKRIVRDQQGNMLDPDGNITTDESKADYYYIAGDQVGSEDYYYIWLHGIITASGDNSANERDWATDPKYDTGRLNTDETWGEVVTLEDLMIALRAKVNTDWFSRLFILHGYKTSVVYKTDPETGKPLIDEETGEPIVDIDEETGLPKAVKEDVVIQPNAWPQDGDGITITDIESKYGLWTNFFLSALGKNDAGGGGGGASMLFDLLDVQIPENPTQENDGQALVYDFTLGKWTNKTIGGGGVSLNEPLAGINSAALGAPSQAGVGIVWNGTAWVYRAINAGSVTSVGLTVPTGFVVNGSPVTSSGTIGLAFADGYSLPTTAKQNNWDTAYLWGNHATAGYALTSNVYTKADADAKFMTIAAFENLFNPLNSSDQKVSHPYSSGVASIKAMVGLWTEQYLSALGKSDSGTSGVSLLGDLLDVRISNPTVGQVLKYRIVNGVGEWYNGTDEGVSTVSWSNITNKPTTFTPSAHTHAWSDITSGVPNFATQDWVGQNYLSIAFFRSLFKAYNGSTEVVPNGGNTSTIDNIKAMFGFWTEQYISALGKSESSGAAFDEDAMWEALGRSGSQQINSSHLATALAPYALKTDIPTLQTLTWSYGSVTSASGNSYNGSTSRAFVIPKSTSHLTNDSGFVTQATADERYLRLTGGTMTGGFFMKSALNADNIGTRTGSAISISGKLGYPESGNGTVGGIGFMYGRAQNGENDQLEGIYITADPTKDNYSTVGGLYITADDVLWKGLPLMKQGDAYTKTESDNKYLPLTAGSSKALTGSLYFSSRSKGIFEPYAVGGSTVNIPLIYDNGTNIWLGATATDATHHIGRTYISAGHDGTSGNDTIYVCVPNAANTSGTNYGVLHMGNYIATLDTRYVTLATAQTVTGTKTFTPQQNFTNGIKIGTYEIVPDPQNGGLHIKGGLYTDTYVSALGLSDSGNPAFDEDAMWEELGRSGSQQINSSHLSTALAPYALKTDIPTLSTLTWSYGSVASASGNSYNGSASRLFVIPKATSHLTNDSGFITSSSLGSYLPLSAGSSKPLTGSLYLSGRGMGIFMPYTVSGSVVNIPLIYDNGSNLWIGSTQTASTHHLGSTYISAGTTGNGTIYVSVPNEDNNNATNYGVLHLGNYSSTLDTRYVTLSTAQRITGEKKFNYPYGMVMDRDTSNYKNISRVFASNGTTQIGYIGYINTTQRMFLSAQDNTDPWTDTIGKYQLMVGVDELTYNTYSILHAGNSSISGSTVTINGSSIDAVRYLYDASSEWKETSGTFFFGGAGVLKSGYDYVGIQAGNNVDKWQIVGIDGLQWRQNDSGGTNTANWTDWRTFIDSSNYTNYVKPKYYLSRKSLSSKGWYRVAYVKQYGTSFLLTICGNYNNSGPATPVTYLVSHSYTTDDIRQVGGCATIGHVNAVRVVRYASGKIYIDIYYSVDVANGIGVEITPLDEKSSWLSSSIDMIDFESVSSSIPSGQTLVDTKYVNKTGLEGIYTMNGGQQGPGYFGKSAVGFLMSNQSINGDSSYKNWMYMDNYFGTDVGGTTAIGVSRSSGRMFVMRSDSSRTSWNTLREVVVADTTGNVGIGYGNTAASYKLDVNGAARVKDLWIGSIHITEDSVNGGIHIANGGMSANTYVSALGVGEQGGGSQGLDIEAMWTELGTPNSSRQIDSTHISVALNGYATQNWVTSTALNGYATQNWVNQQGFVTSAGITSIAVSVPTGLKVNSKNSDTLTSNGTFAITFTDGYSIPTTTKQGQWDTAYTNSHTHSNKSVLDGITSAKVSNWDSAYSTVNTIGGYFTNGSANTAVKLKTPCAINGTNFDGSAAITTTKWGTARNISIADSDATNTGSAISVDGSSAVTLKLPGTIKASLSGNATTATTASKLSTVSKTAWGQTYWTSGGVPTDVSGSIEAGNSGGYIGGFDHIDLNTHASLYGYGGYIDFYYNGANSYTSRIIEENSGLLALRSPYTLGLLVGGYNGDYVQIGQIRIVYESSNNALRIENANGGAANLYAIGGISALGMSGNADGTISGNLIPSTNATYSIGSSSYGWKELRLSQYGVSGRITIDGDGINIVSNEGGYLSGALYMVTGRMIVGASDDDYDGFTFATEGTSYLSSKVSIGGTNTNSDKLYVNGSMRSSGISYASSHNNTSDARLKNIIGYEEVDVETIARAPLIKFTWKDGDSRVHIGTTAQYWLGTELHDVIEQNDYLSMDYAATALAGVISVARKVMTHEERIKALEEENERLRNEIEILKAA